MATISSRNGRFQVAIRRKGHPAIFNTFPTKQSAAYWAKQVEAEIALGIYKPPVRLTVSELLDKYARALPSREYRRCRILTKALGDYWVDALTTQTLTEFRDKRLNDGKAAQTVKHDLGLLNRALKWGASELGITLPELPKIKLPSLNNARERYITRSEILMILRAMRQYQASEATRAAVLLAYFTGLRRSELTKYELHERCLYLKSTKNGQPRKVPLHRSAWITAKVVADNKPNTTNLSRAFAKAIERSGIEKAVFHDLRHTAVTNYFKQGLNIPEVAALSGHKTWSMLQRYTHLMPEEVVRNNR